MLKLTFEFSSSPCTFSILRYSNKYMRFVKSRYLYIRVTIFVERWSLAKRQGLKVPIVNQLLDISYIKLNLFSDSR